MAEEFLSIDEKIEALTIEFMKALEVFEEVGTAETYEARWAAEVALNQAVVQKRSGRPGASIVIEEN